MSVELDVTFNATSFAEFSDKLTVICDENVFDVKIIINLKKNLLLFYYKNIILNINIKFNIK